MRIVVAGTPEVAVPSLDALRSAGHEILAVVTRPDAPAGRGRKLQPSPMAVRAVELGIPVLKPGKAVDVLPDITALAPDCCPVIAYGNLLPQSLLDVPPHGWINLHFSLLPRWRGAAPVQRAVMAGDVVTGAATFRIVRALDAGPVFRTFETPIAAEETAGELLGRLSVDGAQLLCGTLEDIAAGAQPTPQPEDGITTAPKITVEEARLDFGRPVDELDRLVRGCNPAPGAWTTFRGERLKVLTARPTYGVVPEGEVQASKREVLVGTSSRALGLLTVQPHGRKPMAAPDWARGVSFAPHERLGDPVETGGEH